MRTRRRSCLWVSPVRWRLETALPHLWAGIDAGKTHHHCVVIDAEGSRLLSRKVGNDESELLDLIAEVSGLGADGEVTWATDLNHGGAALLIALLSAHDQRLRYIPGRTVHHESRIYRGTGRATPRTRR
jgi:hypothetical protein